MITRANAFLISHDEREKLQTAENKTMRWLCPVVYQDHLFGIAVEEDDLMKFVSKLDTGCSND